MGVLLEQWFCFFLRKNRMIQNWVIFGEIFTFKTQKSIQYSVLYGKFKNRKKTVKKIEIHWWRFECNTRKEKFSKVPEKFCLHFWLQLLVQSPLVWILSSTIFLIPCYLSRKAFEIAKFVEINFCVGCMDWPWLHLLKEWTFVKYWWDKSNLYPGPRHFVPSPNPFWPNPIGRIGHWHH